LHDEKWGIMSSWNFSMKSTHDGQQVVISGSTDLELANRSTNSWASSMIVRSAPKLVSKTALKPIRRRAA